MATAKIIVIWGNQNILRNSIERILANRVEWSVVSVTNQRDLECSLRWANEQHTEVVVVLEGCHNDPDQLPLWLLNEPQTTKVIAVSLEDNLIDVYSKQKVYYRQASDLVDLIEAKTIPPC